MSKKKSNSIPKKKANSHNNQTRALCGVFAILAVIAIACICRVGYAAVKARPNVQEFETKAAAIKEEMSGAQLNYTLDSETPNRVVFISVSDSSKPARVFVGTGDELDQAWDKAISRAKSYLGLHPTEPKWVKGDVVIRSQVNNSNGLLNTIDDVGYGAFRCGIASDTDYSTALLETQVVASDAISYTPATLDWAKLINYAKKVGINLPKYIPEKMVLFQTAGWIVDNEDGMVVKLHSDGGAFGSRVVDAKQLTAEDIRDVCSKAMDYLARTTDDNGKYQYIYYPGTDEVPDDYNLVRHAGTFWAMVEEYSVSKDPELGEAIKRAAQYLKNRAIPLTIGDGVVLIGEDDTNLAIGGCGLALVGYTRFIDEFGEIDGITLDFCRELADGMISLQEKDGSFQNILNRDMTMGEKFVTPYYDGEVSFGLCRLYELTKDKKYLDAAKLSAENYLNNGYLSYHDHWASYFMNELTKYVDDPRYYEFAMRNVMEDQASLTKTVFAPYRLEMAMACYETYQRMMERGIEIDYDISIDSLKSIIRRCVENEMIGCLWPEYAMYMAKPTAAEGAFFWRDEMGLYVENDNTQHAVVGLIKYNKYIEDFD